MLESRESSNLLRANASAFLRSSEKIKMDVHTATALRFNNLPKTPG